VQALGGGYLMMYSFVPPLVGAIRGGRAVSCLRWRPDERQFLPELQFLPRNLRRHDRDDALLPAGRTEGGAGLGLCLFSERLVPDLLQGW
jgi:hypothetical protein